MWTPYLDPSINNIWLGSNEYLRRDPILAGVLCKMTTFGTGSQPVSVHAITVRLDQPNGCMYMVMQPALGRMCYLQPPTKLPIRAVSRIIIRKCLGRCWRSETRSGFQRCVGFLSHKSWEQVRLADRRCLTGKWGVMMHKDALKDAASWRDYGVDSFIVMTLLIRMLNWEIEVIVVGSHLSPHLQLLSSPST